jgi:hypothetical protein
MKLFQFLIVIVFVLVTHCLLFAQFQYSDYQSLLQKYVVGDKVNYTNLLQEKDKLLTFTAKIGDISPDSHPEQFTTRDEQLAFWINAYNAFILKIIIENYPVESIKDINFIGFTVWLSKNLIGGEEISFKSLEDDIIRDRFKDPRIHFAINCASFSCPPLQNQVFLADNLDDLMDLSTKSFINNENNFKIDEVENIIYLSSIFDWYDADFLDWLKKEKNMKEPHLLDYIKLYYTGQIDSSLYNYEFEFFEYDWSLNDYKQ